ARMPATIVALVTLTLLSWYFAFPVETIGTRFHAIPQGLPAFALPEFSWETVKLLVTPTITIALLGAIESLLCARVADQLSSLTGVFGLTVAVQVGLVLACALFIRKMSSLFRVELVARKQALLQYKLYGALFFGAVAKIDEVVQAVENGPKEPVVVLDALQLV